MRIVVKLGGTSVASLEGINRACNLIVKMRKEENDVVVVVSALAGVTNRLLEVSEMARRGKRDFLKKFISEIRSYHENVYIKAVKNEKAQGEVRKAVNKTLKELENTLVGVASLRELTPRVKDLSVACGETMSAPILAGALRSRGITAQSFTGKEVGIVTDSNFGSARPLMQLTMHQVSSKLIQLLEKKVIPVVTGFIAADQHGEVTTLGRGGSDYTATILGSAIKADEIWILTDVDGIMTTDPKIESTVKTIPQVSYQEALEMAYFGAKRIHPRALEPGMDAAIPIRIRNSFNPKNLGTLITNEQRVEKGSIVKAITLIRTVATVTVSGTAMAGKPGVAAKLFSLLAEKNVNVLMISQASSEVNISFVILRDTVDDIINTLDMNLLGGDFAQDIKTETDVCIIALVGAGMRGTPGIAARIFNAVGKKNINIRMIAQGSSELNVSFVVKETDGEAAVRVLHKEFNLGKR